MSNPVKSLGYISNPAKSLGFNPGTLKYWVPVQRGQSYFEKLPWREGASLALVGHPSSDGVTIKMPYWVDVFIDQLCTPSFPIGLVKTESGFIVRSVETGLGR